MSEPTWNEEEVFLRAVAMPADRRDAFISEACPDTKSAERIRALLRHHQDASDEFLRISIKPGVEVPPFTQIDEFRILQQIGEGGMGVVYLAEDTILGRPVALKVLADHLVGSEVARGRFREEARNAASLKHPAIVPVFRFGETDTECYLVTEFVDGPPLSEVISERRASVQSQTASSRMAWYRHAAEVAAVIADALDCAHRARIVHRDVKPSNILLDRARGPRLADFGIARHMVEDDRTQTSIIGSCHYMSPEQADMRTKRIDQRSDVYSLGVVLYEMLSLRRPFDGASPAQILRAIVESPPGRLRTMDRSIPIDLETICHKAIEKMPADRYPTAAHVSADLRCFLADEPIVARPPSMGRRIVRKIKRRRTALLTLATIVILAALLWQSYRLYRPQSALVHVDCADPSADILVAPFDAVSRTYGAYAARGVAPTEFQLPVGQYRIAVVDSADQFCETSVVILRDVDETTIDMPAPHAPSLFSTAVERGEMIEFKGGLFTPITSDETGGPGRQLVISPFLLDAAEVSNGAYQSFLKVTNEPAPAYWEHSSTIPDFRERPVVGVTWAQATAYARYVGKRLPTAYEWEYAMRQPDGRLWPWGNAPAPPWRVADDSGDTVVRASLRDRSIELYRRNTHPVRSDPECNTPLGLFHGATNVSEWTDTILLGVTTRVMIKGASYATSPSTRDFASTTTFPFASEQADGRLQQKWSMQLGFRCARSVAVIMEN